MIETILCLVGASLIYPFAALMVAITGPHSAYEREANRQSWQENSRG